VDRRDAGREGEGGQPRRGVGEADAPRRLGSGDRIEIELSPLGGAGTASPTSPLGAAVIGKRVGDTVEISAPRGAWKATILELHD